MSTAEQSALLGDLLRSLRRRRGITQEEMAELVPGGISADTISNVERGRVRPHRSTLVALLDVLGVSSEDRAAALSAWRVSPQEAQLRASTSFPSPPTPLIGRDLDVAEVVRAFSEGKTRLLTLTGPGGVGKTRVALAAAERLEPCFSDGGSLVDLSGLGDREELLPAIVLGVGLADSGDRPVQESLIAYLRSREFLLVLDNCESFVEAASDLLASILESCPGLRVIATSRVALRLRGEQEFPIAPLPLPEVETSPSLEELARVPSVQLFLDRARAMSPGIDLSSDNAAVVCEICSRLDGLPLALELAAARVRHLSLQGLLRRLQPALALLTAGPRDLPARQRTLRATIDWSHELLTDPEQRVFRRLSVFAGGFTAGAAFTVCGDTEIGPDEFSFLEVMHRLLDNNLLMRNPDEGSNEPRYRMLDTIRTFASEQLEARGEEPSIRHRHASFLCDLAEASFSEIYSAARQPWIDALRSEHDNLLAALSWTLDGEGSPDTG